MAAEAGLNITVLPAARTAVMPPQGIAIGKFQGEITRPTPFPLHSILFKPARAFREYG